VEAKMSVLTISYDLRKPGRNYESLYEGIKALGSWCHALESTWFVDTNKSATDAANMLWKHMDSNDGLFVGRLTKEAAWAGLSDIFSEWLKTHI
jgi:hypothetical protein